MSRAELAFARHGQGGEPLLLLHAGPDGARSWSRCAPLLARAGFDAIAPELRRVVDAAAHSADLYALVRDRLQIERVGVVAGGPAGAVSQDLTLRFPGFVERLVLWSCPLPDPGQVNPTPTLLLVPLADPSLQPDWERVAKRAFPVHAGPLRLPGVGAEVHEQAAERLADAISSFAGPRERDAWPDAEIAYVGWARISVRASDI